MYVELPKATAKASTFAAAVKLQLPNKGSVNLRPSTGSLSFRKTSS